MKAILYKMFCLLLTQQWGGWLGLEVKNIDDSLITPRTIERTIHFSTCMRTSYKVEISRLKYGEQCNFFSIFCRLTICYSILKYSSIFFLLFNLSTKILKISSFFFLLKTYQMIVGVVIKKKWMRKCYQKYNTFTIINVNRQVYYC